MDGRSNERNNADTLLGETSTGKLLLDLIRETEAARQRVLEIIETNHLKESPGVQDALIKLDCFLQSLRQKYESWLRVQRQS